MPATSHEKVWELGLAVRSSFRFVLTWLETHAVTVPPPTGGG